MNRKENIIGRLLFWHPRRNTVADTIGSKTKGKRPQPGARGSGGLKESIEMYMKYLRRNR